MENFNEILEAYKGAKMLVVGAGGGGSNAINYMISQNVKGVDFAIVNTDIQAIQESIAPKKLQIGIKLTRGLGAGANPEIGRKAAEESIEDIEAMLEGYDLVFVAVGLGGGSGTGSAPVVAEVARRKGILTVAVVTLPFGFEGRSRMKKAMEGKRELTEHVDTIITIPNDRLTGHVQALGKKFNMKKAFEEVNNVLLQAVTGITNLITKPGLINLDFADVKTIMSIRGASLMGMGVGTGEDRIRQATEAAMRNPLLEQGIDGAQGILFNITGNENLDYEDFILANEIISQYISEDAEIITGTVLDETIPEDTVYVTVVATGFPELNKQVAAPMANNARLVNSLQDRNMERRPVAERAPMMERTPMMEREPVQQPIVEEQYEGNNDFVTKEMNSIFEGLDMPSFMRNLGRN
ncbi:cell division protein FtsZ [Bacillus cereus]|uniref:Cell division protein FtsZ n=3 Tax=Bacillus cereus group TaxID=86661 RepID=A0A9X6WJ09_BACTU|nr:MULTISPECIES: cell division protein FtsZ [Bacillus cereus group]PFJ31051.1 cell division protein FtsZ [Bacillus thuringiensis]PGP11519.1 cell division protein FtsZ [Bacillus cereus]